MKMKLYLILVENDNIQIKISIKKYNNNRRTNNIIFKAN